MDRLPSHMRVAATMARKSIYKTFRVGAVLAKGRRIISAGYNQYKKSHPLIARYGQAHMVGLHAELHACLGVEREELDGASIYVVRLLRSGGYGASRPCPDCTRFLRERGVIKTLFTDGDGGVGKIYL